MNPRLTPWSTLRHCAAVHRRSFPILVALGQGLLIWRGFAAEQPVDSSEIPLKEVFVIRSVARSGRSVIHQDSVEAQIVKGTWQPPASAQTGATGATGEQRWETATSAEPGVLQGSLARGGYVYWPVRSDRAQVMLLQASGHSCVYVNGEIRGGDNYGLGYLRIPVFLQAGTNHFLFHSGRGDLRVKLMPATGPLSIHTADSTLPDLIQGEREPLWGATVLLNATTNAMRASLRAVERGSEPQVVSIPPLGIFKAPFLLRPPRKMPTNSYSVILEAVPLSGVDRTPTRGQIELRVRRPEQTCQRTFRSEVDDSVQYYAVNPASGSLAAGARPALFFSLHGAGVEARGQADAYSPKSSGPIVCPTNRRPYGFDWEEWGRWDALEVLNVAKARYNPDPQRIYLTGHSMGGHGTWQLGALFPDQFAAVGPSAGWISFTSYASPNRPPATNEMQKMLARAAASSDTLLMVTNYLQEGIYVLHGDADDNVPVGQAREMRRVLGAFHRDLDFHEQPGAGHWWDASDEPGADCVDWAPLFDFFSHHRIPKPAEVRRIRFATVNPAVSARAHWATIIAQQRSLELSAVDLQRDPVKRRVFGTTTNVAVLRLDLPPMGAGDLLVELDGQKVEGIRQLPPAAGRAAASLDQALYLLRTGERWQVSHPPSPDHKSADRSGPFREAFRRHMALVYATQGSAEENAWSLAKARYDAETFYYRGNASIELIADVDVVRHFEKPFGRRQSPTASRNLVLYGHADCNAAWEPLLANSPVQVRRGSVRLGEHTWRGDDVACLFLQPNPRDAATLVGVVAASGLPGMRVADRMPYFVSGAGFPDCLVVGAELPTEGSHGLRAAGFFGQDWQVGSGDFAWRETDTSVAPPK
ncbi:MAG: prolyl oligopeptidase family serine peptidase [Verrucomicrobiota bacterium]